MARPNLGKSATIKERRIDIYAPDLGVKGRWDQHAARRKQSRSEMVFELVELGLALETGKLGATVARDGPKADELRAQLAALRRQNQDLQEAKERVERELADVRAAIAVGEAPLPNLGHRLVSLFIEAVGADGQPRPVDASELRRALQIEPGSLARTRELQQAIATLELQGMVRAHAKGWVWLGESGARSPSGRGDGQGVAQA